MLIVQAYGSHAAPLRLEVVVQELVHREAVRKADRRRQHVGERPGAEARESDRRGVDSRRHGGAQRPVTGYRVLARKHGGRRSVRRRTLPVDDRHLSIARRIDNDWSLAAETEMRDLDNGGSEDGRNAGIDGIPAGGEQLGAGVDRERSAGSDHPVRRADLAAHLPRRRRRWLLREHGGTAQDDRRGCAENSSERITSESYRQFRSS